MERTGFISFSAVLLSTINTITRIFHYSPTQQKWPFSKVLNKEFIFPYFVQSYLLLNHYYFMSFLLNAGEKIMMTKNTEKTIVTFRINAGDYTKLICLFVHKSMTELDIIRMKKKM